MQAVPVYGVFTDHEAELGKVKKKIKKKLYFYNKCLTWKYSDYEQCQYLGTGRVQCSHADKGIFKQPVNVTTLFFGVVFFLISINPSRYKQNLHKTNLGPESPHIHSL